MTIIRPCIQECISVYFWLFILFHWLTCLSLCERASSVADEESAFNAGDTGNAGSIPGLRRSPGEGYGNPIQYSHLRNPVDRGTWWATVKKVTKSQHDWATKHTLYAKTILCWFLYLCNMFWNQRPPALLLFLRLFCLFGVLWDLVLTVGWIFNIRKKFHWDFNRNCIKSLNYFEQLNNIKSPNP